jgi:hypothetical protein
LAYEVRNRIILPNMGTTLHLCDVVGADNLGVTMDVGHAFIAGESPAAELCVGHHANRIFYIHFNDNDRGADWDMLPASVNLWETRTGKITQWSQPSAFGADAPGVGRDAAKWLNSRGMVVLGTDTPSTEPSPFADPADTLHKAMPVEAGVHLIENLWLEELSADGVTEALFVALPVKLTGATGSWLRPVAIV